MRVGLRCVKAHGTIHYGGIKIKIKIKIKIIMHTYFLYVL
jgi:hypothetical protein